MQVNLCGAAAGVWTTATTSMQDWATAPCSSTTPETPARTSRSCSRYAPGTRTHAHTHLSTVWKCSYDVRSKRCAGLSLESGFRGTSGLVSRCPVASLCYVPRAASSSFPCGGLIAGSLEGGCFWEQVSETTYRPHVLPLETAGCTDIQVETESRHCLVTYRPGENQTPWIQDTMISTRIFIIWVLRSVEWVSCMNRPVSPAGRSNPSLRCVLMALNRTPQQDSSQLPSCSCSPVQTFSAGSSCKLLTKNAVFRSPDGGGTLVCAGDEASNSTMVSPVGVCVWPEAVSRVFQPQAWWKNKEMFVIFEINFVKKTFFFIIQLFYYIQVLIIFGGPFCRDDYCVP